MATFEQISPFQKARSVALADDTLGQETRIQELTAALDRFSVTHSLSHFSLPVQEVVKRVEAPSGLFVRIVSLFHGFS
jgi:hypothetical protein